MLIFNFLLIIAGFAHTFVEAAGCPAGCGWRFQCNPFDCIRPRPHRVIPDPLGGHTLTATSSGTLRDYARGNVYGRGQYVIFAAAINTGGLIRVAISSTSAVPLSVDRIDVAVSFNGGRDFTGSFNPHDGNLAIDLPAAEVNRIIRETENNNSNFDVDQATWIVKVRYNLHQEL
jgi:hypothetical protein